MDVCRCLFNMCLAMQPVASIGAAGLDSQSRLESSNPRSFQGGGGGGVRVVNVVYIYLILT